MGEERVGELVVVGVRARAQSLLELGQLGRSSIRIADVCRLNFVKPLVFGGDVTEVGDGGDVIRVDPCVLGLLPEAVVEVHVVVEVAANVRADAGDERRHVGGSVGVARRDDSGRALVLLVVVEVEEVSGGESLIHAIGVSDLFLDGLEVFVGHFCSLELFSGNAFF